MDKINRCPTPRGVECKSMANYTQIIYHLVFSTKNREKTLQAIEKQEELYKFISGLLQNKKCHLYRINGTDDHLHTLTGLHPTICLSDLIKDIKVSTSIWIKDNRIFPNFNGWQEGYGAFTCSFKDKENIIGYIINQKEHHKTESYEDEFRGFLKLAGIEYDEKYLFT
jgi:putative transposase